MGGLGAASPLALGLDGWPLAAGVGLPAGALGLPPTVADEPRPEPFADGCALVIDATALGGGALTAGAAADAAVGLSVDGSSLAPPLLGVAIVADVGSGV